MSAVMKLQIGGVSRTLAHVVPPHKFFPKPVVMKTERFNNSIQHGATSIVIEMDVDPNGDYIIHYSDNGDGDCDHVRFTSPQSNSAEGASQFGVGNWFDRLSGDPNSAYSWEEAFKKAGDDNFVIYRGPFTETGVRQIEGTIAPNAKFTTPESSGMSAKWRIEKNMLVRAFEDANDQKKDVDMVILEHFREMFGMKYSQSIIDRLYLKFRVGEHVFISTPEKPMRSLETVLRQEAKLVKRFPGNRVKCSDTLNAEYEFYRAFEGVKSIPEYPHYGSRVAESSHVMIQMDAGFGLYTVEDMPLTEALNINGGGSLTAISGCTAYVKFTTKEKTERGLPNVNKLPGTQAVKIQVDKECPRITEFVFQYLRNSKNLPLGWKATKNAVMKDAPGYVEPPKEIPAYATVTVPTIESRPNGFVARIMHAVQPRQESAAPDNGITLPSWIPPELKVRERGSKLEFTYTTKSRIHDMERDICQAASAIGYYITTKNKADNYSIRCITPNIEKFQAALSKFKTTYPFLTKAEVSAR